MDRCSARCPGHDANSISTLLGTLRIGRDISHTIDERVGAGFTFRVNKYVSLSPNYVHIGMQPFAGRRIWKTG